MLSQHRCSIQIGPFSIFFTNVNKRMGIPGHSHFAQVTICYDTLSDVGFPSFQQTHDVIQDALKQATAKTFRDCTNENVVDILFNVICNIKHPDIDKWGGVYRVAWVELAVRGVPDKIGHSDGFTKYKVDAFYQENNVSDNKAV
jgi:hypothetical protein